MCHLQDILFCAYSFARADWNVRGEMDEGVAVYVTYACISFLASRKDPHAPVLLILPALGSQVLLDAFVDIPLVRNVHPLYLQSCLPKFSSSIRS